MPELRTVLILADKELRDSARNRWFILYAASFLVLTLALSWIALSGAGGYGVPGFGRTTASLVNLVLLIVPLMGLTLGALAVAGERERGELAYTLSLPVSVLEVLIGKYLGLSLALASALVLGYGVSGIVIAFHAGSGQLAEYLILVAITVLLALGSLSLGFLISVWFRRGATALGVAVFVWLGLAFLSDLGLMGTALVLRVDATGLLGIALLNPLQVFKMASILTIQNNLDVLGPAGTYAVRTYGDAFLPALLGILCAWLAVPLAVAYPVFRWRGAI